jgi:alpha-ribazole phosphatase
MLTLHFLRHGESQLSHLFRGWTDDPLTQNGWQQMQASLDKAAQNGVQFDAVVTSNLQRCQQFAEHITKAHHVPLLILDDLRELNFGDWEGKSGEALFNTQADTLTKFWQTPTQYTPPNGEPISQFAQRIDRATRQIAEFAEQHHFANLLIITHGGVIKYCYIKALQQSLDNILSMPAQLGSLHTFELIDNTLLKATG